MDQIIPEKEIADSAKMAGMINCVGCRIDGIKTPYCEALCPIRQCALESNVETCGGCREIDGCEKLGAIITNNTEAYRKLNYKVLSSAACSLNSIILAMVSVAVSSSNFLANSLPDSNNIGMSL